MTVCVDHDDLIELLDRFTLLVPEENYRKLIELARQQLIQKSRLMTYQWRNAITSLKEDIRSPTSLHDFFMKDYIHQQKSLLKTSPENDTEREFLSYLKRFIRDLDDKTLSYIRERSIREV